MKELKSDSEKKIQPGLEFAQEILYNETKNPDEIETTDLFLKLKFTEFLTMFFTILCNFDIINFSTS
jgi:hypothetical protein